MHLAELILLSIGLSMDAFAVSICKGLSVKKPSAKCGLTCGFWFGGFQGLMPFLGYLIGKGFARIIDRFAGWGTFIILVLIGLNMIKEGITSIENKDIKESSGKNAKISSSDLGLTAMLAAAVATSIDALAVGVTFIATPVEIFSLGSLPNTLFACLFIALTTCLISFLGARIGGTVGNRYEKGSRILGGIILILLGLKAILW